MKRPNEFKAHFAGQWDTLDALFSFTFSVANLAQKIVQLEYWHYGTYKVSLWNSRQLNDKIWYLFLSSMTFDILFYLMKMYTFTKSIICCILLFCTYCTIMTRQVFLLHSCWLSYSMAGTISVIFFCKEAWFLIIETFVVIPEAVQICKLRAHVWFRIFYKNSAKLFNFHEKKCKSFLCCNHDAAFWKIQCQENTVIWTPNFKNSMILKLNPALPMYVLRCYISSFKIRENARPFLNAVNPRI